VTAFIEHLENTTTNNYGVPLNYNRKITVPTGHKNSSQPSLTIV
jgi:hypothetical protein